MTSAPSLRVLSVGALFVLTALAGCLASGDDVKAAFDSFADALAASGPVAEPEGGGNYRMKLLSPAETVAAPGSQPLHVLFYTADPEAAAEGASVKTKAVAPSEAAEFVATKATDHGLYEGTVALDEEGTYVLEIDATPKGNDTALRFVFEVVVGEATDGGDGNGSGNETGGNGTGGSGNETGGNETGNQTGNETGNEAEVPQAQNGSHTFNSVAPANGGTWNYPGPLDTPLYANLTGSSAKAKVTVKPFPISSSGVDLPVSVYRSLAIFVLDASGNELARAEMAGPDVLVNGAFQQGNELEYEAIAEDVPVGLITFRASYSGVAVNLQVDWQILPPGAQ